MKFPNLAHTIEDSQEWSIDTTRQLTDVLNTAVGSLMNNKEISLSRKVLHKTLQMEKKSKLLAGTDCCVEVEMLASCSPLLADVVAT